MLFIIWRRLKLWQRFQVLNTVDVTVVFVDVMLLLVELSTQVIGPPIALVRLVRTGRVIRYFRVMKNIRSSRLLKAFKRNAHIIYHELLAWRYLLFLSILVITDVVMMGLYGAGHLDDDQSPTHQALGFGIFVSFFCLIEYLLRIACHKAVIGELKSFFFGNYYSFVFSCFHSFSHLLFVLKSKLNITKLQLH